jgi:MFS transporter, AAHS family, 4-hydroxybenzoate transporter
VNSEHPFDLQRFIDERPVGRFQWLVLILCLSVLIVDGVDTLAVAFIAPAAMKEWGVGGHAFSPVLMGSLAGVALGSFLAGPFSDRFGRKTISIVALFTVALFSFASSTAHDVTSLAGLRFLTGLGLGASIPNALVTMAEYAPARHRSFMVTTVFCGISVGAGVAGFLYALLEPRFGWRSMLIAGGVLPILLAPLLMIFLPESARFLLLKAPEGKRLLRIVRRMRGSDQPSEIAFVRPIQAEKVRNPLSIVISPAYRRRTIMLWIAYFSIMYMTYTVASWLPTLARRSGFSLADAALLNTAWAVGGIVGALVVGWQMDRWRPRNVLLATLVLALFVCASAYEAPVGSIYVAILFLLGCCVLGIITGLGAAAAAAYETAARVTGTSCMLGVGRIGGLVGITVGASLIEAGWTLGPVLAALSIADVFCILGIACLPNMDSWMIRDSRGIALEE